MLHNTIFTASSPPRILFNNRKKKSRFATKTGPGDTEHRERELPESQTSLIDLEQRGLLRTVALEKQSLNESRWGIWHREKTTSYLPISAAQVYPVQSRFGEFSNKLPRKAPQPCGG
ncbi:conserved hypothetical protein [Coccidioides posadasii str. Silveira]|uniref:Uncharacterized protein n=1 Tax=Coccidioides posadasii (strain RMSCC 757 / Silveira) TaxID=443226 RepID=E9DC96_COCPS|nr:conserved hypothetical protein [Coccidioides posadasii str. Silveira]